jgi:protein-histidine pros-kinase
MDSLFEDSSGFEAVAGSMVDQPSGLRHVRWRGADLIVVWVPVRASVPELDWTLGLMVPAEMITAQITTARVHAMVTVLVAVLSIAVLTLAATNRVVNSLRDFDRRRARELAETNVRLLEASRMKTQFLATMSHELRTPLNSIMGFSEILRGRLDDPSDGKLRRFADNIHRSGQQLLALITEILDLSKIEAGRMELNPERVMVAEILDGVCEIVRGTAKERGVTVELDCPEEIGWFEVDPVRFKQILFNLLSNAIKFSEEGSPVEVVAQGLSRDESPLGMDSVRVAVVDRGIGIADSDREVIFDEFRQLEAWQDRKYSGAGLGLTLVKRFVDFHGGVIGVESTPGKGSTFTVDLPRKYQGAEPEVRA